MIEMPNVFANVGAKWHDYLIKISNNLVDMVANGTCLFE